MSDIRVNQQAKAAGDLALLALKFNSDRTTGSAAQTAAIAHKALTDIAATANLAKASINTRARDSLSSLGNLSAQARSHVATETLSTRVSTPVVRRDNSVEIRVGSKVVKIEVK
jgi:hypothetical protein